MRQLWVTANGFDLLEDPVFHNEWYKVSLADREWHQKQILDSKNGRGKVP